MPGRILVIQMAKLGDFIQSTPLLANLRRNHPGSQIILAGEQPAVLEAARLSPLVDDTLARPDGAPAPVGDFEAVYTLNSHPRAMALASEVKAAARFGPTLENGRPRYTPAQNFLMDLMRLDRRLGRFNLVDVWASLAEPSKPSPLVWPNPGTGPEGAGGGKFSGESPYFGSTCLSDARSELLRQNKERPEEIFPPPAPGERPKLQSGRPAFKIGLQLGSKNHLRRWPVEDFVSLSAELAAAGINFVPVLLGSADERALGRKFKKLLGGRAAEPINLIGATDLQGLGAAVAGLDLLITADTGVMHLAAALRTPVLALFFGPAYGPETGPYGRGHIIYQALAPCAPCREGDGCRSRQCLNRPEPLRVARLAEDLLGTRPLADEDSAEPWPEGHRVWRTEIDAFGQSLRPLRRPQLSRDEFLALALTEAGREIIRPGYQMRAEQVASLIAAYQVPAGLVFDPQRLDQAPPVGRGHGPASFEKTRARALELAGALGLEIA